MKSDVQTVEQYIAALPDDRRSAIQAVRSVILKSLPTGYEEAMNWGMIVYQVPLSVYPDTYNKQPLSYVALANQKNYMALYLMCVYADESLKDTFIAEYKATGKKLDMGKSCVRFKKLDDLPLDVVARYVAAVPMERYIQRAKLAKTK